MALLGSFAGRVARKFGSKSALVVGSVVSGIAFLFAALEHAHPYDMLITSALLGVGIGLAFSALGNLIVQAVPPHQTGIASGMNTVMRTLGGALGGQISATFIAGHVLHGHPTVTGFTESYWMATIFLAICALSAILVPQLNSSSAAADAQDADVVGLTAEAA